MIILDDDPEGQRLIYELRFYSVAQGRMQDMHDRFGVRFPALFARHGVNLVARWSALAGPQAPRFSYLLAFRDFAEREAAWASFRQDPEMAHIRDETNAGHELVDKIEILFLKPSAVWAADPAPDEAVGGLHEMVLQEVGTGQHGGANALLRDSWLPALRDAGARVLGVFDVVSGTGMPKIVLIHAWRDAAAWHAGRRGMDADPRLTSAFAAQRDAGVKTAFERTEVNLLEPSPGMVIRAGLGRTT